MHTDRHKENINNCTFDVNCIKLLANNHHQGQISFPIPFSFKLRIFQLGKGIRRAALSTIRRPENSIALQNCAAVLVKTNPFAIYEITGTVIENTIQLFIERVYFQETRTFRRCRCREEGDFVFEVIKKWYE